MLRDIVGESRQEKFGGVTDLDRQLQAQLDRIAAAGVPVYITAYSEGTIVGTKALEAGARLFPGSTVRFAAPAVSEGRARRAVIRAGGIPNYIPTKWNDPINTVQDVNLKMYGGWVGLLGDVVIPGRSSAHDLNNYLPAQANQ